MSDTSTDTAACENGACQPEERFTADYLREASRIAVEMEARRCESLRKMSGTVLTCASIVSVALVTAAQPLFDFFSADAGLSKVLMGILATSLAALFSAIVLALISQLRFAYVALPSPTAIRGALDNGNLFTEMDAARHYSDSAASLYAGLAKRNDIMRGLLTASAIAVFVAIGALFFVAAFLLPCAYGMVG